MFEEIQVQSSRFMINLVPWLLVTPIAPLSRGFFPPGEKLINDVIDCFYKSSITYPNLGDEK